MSETAFLALLLDSPLQSWGVASRFQRRTTGLHPTKSGIIGLICAAMGLAKGSPEESDTLAELAKLNMSSIAIPREGADVRRLEDFHTTGGGYDRKAQAQFVPRKASGGPCKDPTVSRRQYLLDACFGVVLAGDQFLLERAAAALQNPVWGVWLGRKSCIPAAPVYRGLFNAETQAQRELLGDRSIEALTTVTEVKDFAEGTDSVSDQPVTFGDASSSGPDKRKFAVRRIAVKPGIRHS